ncbi:MAG: AMP-binding protein [Brevibacterium aurantiacum]|uniref:class I adenylate-forming enzyme family protein n=1 Tax=Brevibacterium aurantiacum TaxID=273384 RepID=UPI00186795C0|nr:long-chain fatty acid--CoA ligase [Brevibacterium aurantiacum]
MQTSTTTSAPTRSYTPAWVAEAGVTSAFPVADLVGLPANRAGSDPYGPCLSWPGGRLDNTGFASAVAATAHAMRTQFRIGLGAVVGVLLGNGPEFITTMFATWSLGAVLTPINPALTNDEVGFQLDDSGVVLVIGDSRAEAVADVRGLGFLSAADECFRGSAEQSGVEQGDAELGGAEPIRDLNVRGSDGSLIVYTSGTSGLPKGCLLSHANVSAMVWSILNGVDFGDDARSLLVMPLFSSRGLLAGTLSPLMFGGSVHVLPEFDPRTFWDVVEEVRPTYFSAVPAIYSALEATKRRTVDTSSLRFVLSGAAPMSVDATTRFESKFGVTVLEGYGPSEFSAAATLNRNDGTRRLGTAGTALPGITVAIQDPAGRRGRRGGHLRADRYVRLPRPSRRGSRDTQGWLAAHR